MLRVIVLSLIVISLNASNIFIERAIYRVVSSWNVANNNRDIDRFYYLYAPQVIYYGTKLSRDLCIEDKKRFFIQHPFFYQYISNIRYTPITQRLYKVSFNKYVRLNPNRGFRLYPSYLVIDLTDIYNGNIVEEGDSVTDSNLQIGFQRYYFNE